MKNRKYIQETPISETHPELAKEWHPTKNGELTPDNIKFIYKKIWWQCLKNKEHNWETTIADRIGNLKNDRKGTGCPYCANRKVSNDNCLFALNPELSKEWHPTKNVDLTPKDVVSGSHKKVWWKCEKNHEWEVPIKARSTGNRAGCPYCCNQKASDDNCLLNNERLSKEWHPTKNGQLKPSDVVGTSHKKVWWKCEKGHAWQSEIINRVKGNGCPYCSGKKVCEDNCLSTINPEIAKEWHPTKNGKLTAHDVTIGVRKDVWWVCCNNHEWIAPVHKRSAGRGCPYCNKIELKDGFICSSIPEAIKYIEYRDKKLDFIYNKKYNSSFGLYRYDFYFPKDNKYVEITSFNKYGFINFPGRYFKYLRTIIRKRRFVEDVLKANFEFIQFTPIKKQIKMVRENQK